MKTATKTRLYKVVRKTSNKKLIEKGLTLDQARRLIRSFPDSDKSMVVYYEQ